MATDTMTGMHDRPYVASTTQYPVNIRATIPFWPRPLFLTVIIGRERRSRSRLIEERSRHPLLTPGNCFAILAALLLLNIALFFGSIIVSTL